MYQPQTKYNQTFLRSWGDQLQNPWLFFPTSTPKLTFFEVNLQSFDVHTSLVYNCSTSPRTPQCLASCLNTNKLVSNLYTQWEKHYYYPSKANPRSFTSKLFSSIHLITFMWGMLKQNWVIGPLRLKFWRYKTWNEVIYPIDSWIRKIHAIEILLYERCIIVPLCLWKLTIEMIIVLYVKCLQVGTGKILSNIILYSTTNSRLKVIKREFF